MASRDLLPPTRSRVEQNTAREVNQQIELSTDKAVMGYANATNEEIAGRLEQLDREWDIERTLEANAATITLIGLALGAFVHWLFFFLPVIVAAFLLQHALQGWCPPVPIFRRRGVRTAAEIDEERTALRILRGDFQQTKDPQEALRAVRSAKPAGAKR